MCHKEFQMIITYINFQYMYIKTTDYFNIKYVKEKGN